MALAGCSSGSGSDDSSSSTSPASTPTITSLTLNSDVHCSKGDVPVEVVWVTEGADSAALSWDGSEVSTDLDPSGQATINVQCKDGTHEVMLTATNAAGETSRPGFVSLLRG